MQYETRNQVAAFNFRSTFDLCHQSASEKPLS